MLKGQRKTRIEKLVFVDKDGIEHVYIFKVSSSVSKSATDIITTGLFLAQRIGKQRTEDALGRDMKVYGKNVGRSFNAVPKHPAGRLSDMSSIPNTPFELLIKAAIRAGAKYREEHMDEPIGGAAPTKESKLPLLVQTIHLGKKIENDGEKYFIRSSQKCAACPNEIPGKQYLTVAHGKVIATTAITPDDPTLGKAKEGSKKYLCNKCTVKTKKPADWVIGTGAGAEERRRMMETKREDIEVKVRPPLSDLNGKKMLGTTYLALKSKLLEKIDSGDYTTEEIVALATVMKMFK